MFNWHSKDSSKVLESCGAHELCEGAPLPGSSWGDIYVDPQSCSSPVQRGRPCNDERGASRQHPTAGQGVHSKINLCAKGFLPLCVLPGSLSGREKSTALPLVTLPFPTSSPQPDRETRLDGEPFSPACRTMTDD